MPGYVVKEVSPDDATEYEMYKYYFLDRNLGALEVVQSPDVIGTANNIGDFFVFSYPAPGSVPSMGTGAVKTKGWVGDLPSQVNDWNTPGYSPCPKNYFVPTRYEWDCLVQSIPEGQRYLTHAFRLFRFGRTGIRNNNGGVISNSNADKVCVLWAGDKTELTDAGTAFFTRDTDSDAAIDNPDSKHMAVVGPGYPEKVGGPNINNKSGGVPVRAFRKMKLPKE